MHEVTNNTGLHLYFTTRSSCFEEKVAMKRKQIDTLQVHNARTSQSREMCRLCAGIHLSVNMTPLFVGTGSEQHLCQKIQQYTPFRINNDDKLPKQICGICVTTLSNWHNFVECCLKAQQSFVALIEKSKKEQATKSGSSTTPVTNLQYSAVAGAESLCAPTLQCNERESTAGAVTYREGVRGVTATVKSPGRGRQYCVALHCNSNSGCETGLSLFRIPKEKERAHQWLVNAEREDLLELSEAVRHTRYLCQQHFTDDMFSNSFKSRLVWNAVPTVFPKLQSSGDKGNHVNTKTLDRKCVINNMALQVMVPVKVTKEPRKILPKPLEESREGILLINLLVCNVTTPCYCCSSSTNSSLANMAENTTNIVVEEGHNHQKPRTDNMTAPEGFDSDCISDFLSVSAAAKRGADSNECSLADTELCDTDQLCPLEHSFQERVYPCRYCGEMFLVKSSLVLHQTTYHSEHPTVCPLCDKGHFRSNREFMEHMCDHGDVMLAL
ncbi:unnamed protein product [Timema podura]|uniref:Uncharacterized protein n=1 Tax=Timema podura TaxID=61482 RepID=A0ABN7NHP3_TIMPD|nr:unnamed protein product [Timema podura]